MVRFIKRALRAASLLATNPHSFWLRIKPYMLRAESRIIQVNGINFNIDLKLDPAMRHMYFGTYQTEITDPLKRFLRDGDVFIDVGANVGYISAFGLGLVGKAGEVHSFEPVPQYFIRLQNIQKDNPHYHIHLNGVALAENEGTATIAVTNLKNIGWNTMVPDFMSEDTVEEEVDINVTTLDRYLSQNNVRGLRFVKIDTEGYEFPVMKGFQQYLRTAKELPIIVIEVAPAAYPKLGVSLSEFSEFMENLGYVARSVNLINDVEVEKLEKTTDVAFLPRSLAQQYIWD